MNCARAGFAFVVALIATDCLAEDDVLQPMSDVVAINVLLEIGGRIANAARVANEDIRAKSPKSFAFDATHVPHISVLHLYADTAELPAIYAAVDRVAADHTPMTLALVTTGYSTSPWQGGQLINIDIKNTAELARLQDALVKALAQYVVKKGSDRAFATTAQAPTVDTMTIDYVASFVPKHIGEGFKPHVTVGFSDQQTAAQLQSQTITSLTSHPTAIAIYQLGNLGTARRKLH